MLLQSGIFDCTEIQGFQGRPLGLSELNAVEGVDAVVATLWGSTEVEGE
jgi:hypothetical protein